MFTKLEVFLKGKKTYVVAFLLALVALIDVIVGDVSISDFISDPNLVILLQGVGLATLRAGISK